MQKTADFQYLLVIFPLMRQNIQHSQLKGGAVYLVHNFQWVVFDWLPARNVMVDGPPILGSQEAGREDRRQGQQPLQATPHDPPLPTRPRLLSGNQPEPHRRANPQWVRFPCDPITCRKPPLWIHKAWAHLWSKPHISTFLNPTLGSLPPSTFNNGSRFTECFPCTTQDPYPDKLI